MNTLSDESPCKNCHRAHLPKDICIPTCLTIALWQRSHQEEASPIDTFQDSHSSAITQTSRKGKAS